MYIFLAFLITLFTAIFFTIQKLKQRNKAFGYRNAKKKLMFFLGSGGHTTEMLQLYEDLDKSEHSTNFFVYCENDMLTEKKIEELESKIRINYPNLKIQTFTMSRARNVGQSWWTSPFTFIKSFLDSTLILYKIGLNLDAMITNGPGTCLCFIVIGYINKKLRLNPNLKIVYVESLARVSTLSLTGKVAYKIVDNFIVQWPKLKKKYPKAIYKGILV